ncbi:MAG: aspartate/glutamate racemase family protein [Reyranella sp.]|uniref:aspartate/glutamate racemase family protein n=1 Tax=Reyranella sp. TaxID=1929291 RepID=UPI0011F69A2A|nr:aspartate/glutamate racemase family protein [Reyranella sp.]TAJ97085.1 MAG: aspartate/glutamate racemase family protein [Reyranella sp.]TBR29755.1 MAG: aspartate/glutamate racemase family protein [Reyranella sp.]
MKARQKPLGILMLDTRFPRIVGDVGNAASYDFPVIFRKMEGIGSADAVAAHPDRARVLAALKANAEALAAEGVVGLGTSCGFLALYQDDLAAVSPVPVATSALLHIKGLKDRKAGVITASAKNLTPGHLAAVGAPVDTPVIGLPEGSSFAGTFLRNGLTLDREAVEREVVAAGRDLLERYPDVDTVVLECTNLPPYKPALEQALGLPVLDVLDLLKDFYREVSARR